MLASEDDVKQIKDAVYRERDFLDFVNKKTTYINLSEKRKLLEMLYKKECPNSELKKCQTKWIREVARRSGNSVATVSRVIGKIGGVSKKPGRPSFLSTKDKIDLRQMILHKSPQKEGIGSNVWTGETLKQYLNIHYGRIYTVRRCQQFLKEMRQPQHKRIYESEVFVSESAGSVSEPKESVPE